MKSLLVPNRRTVRKVSTVRSGNGVDQQNWKVNKHWSMSNNTDPVIRDLSISSNRHANIFEREHLHDTVTHETKSLDHLSHRTFKDTLGD